MKDLLAVTPWLKDFSYPVFCPIINSDCVGKRCAAFTGISVQTEKTYGHLKLTEKQILRAASKSVHEKEYNRMFNHTRSIDASTEDQIVFDQSASLARIADEMHHRSDKVCPNPEVKEKNLIGRCTKFSTKLFGK